MNNYYAVIMAGGEGTRLWPLSRRAKPKQMLRLFGERTLFQMAVDRLKGIIDPKYTLVVTIADQADALKAECPEIPAENFLIEPFPRGTASVVGLAAITVANRDPDGVMAVLTSDHYIEQVERFREILAIGKSVAEEKYLVTLGIHPTFPSTGYGYIQRSDECMNFRGNPVYRVLRFKEKPEKEVAQQMVEQGDHYWNSGMFIWRATTIIDEFKQQMPVLWETLSKIQDAWHTSEREHMIKTSWLEIKPQTIDYGIMEHAKNVMVVPAEDLGWSDVGSWDSLFDVLPSDENGNLKMVNDAIISQTSGSLVFSENPEQIVVVNGLENIIVVNTPDALLICSRQNVQNIRQLVKYMKETGRSRFL